LKLKAESGEKVLGKGAASYRGAVEHFKLP